MKRCRVGFVVVVLLLPFASQTAWGQEKELPQGPPSSSTQAGGVGEAAALQGGDPVLPEESGSEIFNAVGENPNVPQLTFSAEYLLWWVRRAPLPGNLATTGDVVTGNPLTSSGLIGNPGTHELLGGSQGFGTFSGGRLTAEGWLDSEQTLGFQFSGFFLESRSAIFHTRSDDAGSPILARPFFDVLNNQPSALLVSYPNELAGNLTVTSSLRLWGLEANFLGGVAPEDGIRWTPLAGFRYLDLQERLRFFQATTVLDPGAAALNGLLLNAGDTLLLQDEFHTRNQFYGGQVGFQAEVEFGPLELGLTAKVALGAIHERVAVGGSTALSSPGVTFPADTAEGGALALRTNNGLETSNRLAVVPEVTLKAGYQFSERFTGTIGYSFLYSSEVVRPGDQVNRNINASNVPTSQLFNQANDPALPNALFHHGDFWAQGVNLGVEFRF